MKYILLFLMCCTAGAATSQLNFPDFLEGTWKMEIRDQYERWDKLNAQTLKGFSYEFRKGKMKVSEYLEIVRNKKEITYSASVIGQNQGNAVPFRLMQNDSLCVFENPDHDFPKKIVYRKLSDTKLRVEVSDGKKNGFSYILLKQETGDKPKEATADNPKYDAELASKLGADDYGMKSYVLVILKTGTNDTTDKAFINTCFKGHLENISRLVEEGKMIVAGPLGKNDKTYRGIFILNTPTIEEAEQLLQTDPAVKEKLLAAELYEWYGSAALPEYLGASDKIWKVKP